MGSIAKSIGGQVAGSVAGSIFGKKPSAGGYGAYAPAQFKPFTYRTGLGEAALTTDPFEITSTIDPRLAQLQESALEAAPEFQQEAIRLLTEERPERFEMPAFDPQAAQQRIFEEQSALLQPAFQQQREQLRGTLFGSGRLGLQLAPEVAGLGTGGGLVQPDVLGLARQEQQTLARVGAAARQQARAEQETIFDQALRQAGFNERQRQALLAQVVGAEQTQLQRAVGIGDIEAELQRQAIDFEARRAQAAIGAYQPQATGGGLLSGIVTGAAPAIGQAVGNFAQGLFQPRENIPQLSQGMTGYNPAFTYNPQPLGGMRGSDAYYSSRGETSGGFEGQI
jgi:hypothetical protein